MAQTWTQIQHDWLGTTDIPEPSGVVDAFERVDRVFGAEWLVKALPVTGPPGSFPLLQIALLGDELRALDDAMGTESLVPRLKRGDRDARSELLAARVARGPANGGQLEFAPTVRVGARNRQPDFRIRERESEAWCYVEVTAPDDSAESDRLRTLLGRIQSELRDLSGRFVLEVILRREPSEEQTTALIQTLRALAPTTGPTRLDLPEALGFVLAQSSAPGIVELADHGEPPTSRIGMSFATVVDGVPTSTITIRIAYSDERAARFIDEEARQLPRVAPGLIMVDFGKVIAGRGIWERLIIRRFQPNIHTRVAAVSLFASNVVPVADGLQTRIAARSIVNAHATRLLPDWLAGNLEAWPSDLVSAHSEAPA